MKILVIGSKGFIGKKALTFFSNKENTLCYGCDVVVDYEAENYFLIDAGNSNYNTIFQNEEFDLCINCSGAASVPDSLKNPMRDFNLNTHNVFKILNSIKDFNPTCQFINLSSAAVYGNPDTLPIKENQSLNPVSPYGRHKLMSEMICQMFFDFYHLKTKSLRIFSAYGEGLRKQLFWDLHKKANSGKEISLFGSGKESRDFIHVDDIINIIDLFSLNGSFNGRSINVANGKEIFIKDAVMEYFSNFKNSIDYSFSGSNRKGDPINWVADIKELQQIGYKQSVDFKHGLNKYYNWVEQNA